MPSPTDGGELLRQAAICHEYEAPFTAKILEALPLAAAPQLEKMVDQWPGNRAAAAVALRIASGIHVLARRGVSPQLSALYRDLDGDFETVLRNTLSQHDQFLCDWIASPPQTNEVGRAAAIMAALLVIANRFDQPIALLELGSSGGLNLNLHRYSYDLGGTIAGPTDAKVILKPRWQGHVPPDATISIADARGVDIEPLDLTDDATCERLTAYVWPEQTDRVARLTQAIRIARQHPPRVDKRSATDWLQQRLAERQQPSTTRVIFHSIVLQYLTADDRHHVGELIEQAGRRATLSEPIAWVSFEWDVERCGVRLTLKLWPDGETETLAECHAHGTWIRWLM